LSASEQIPADQHCYREHDKEEGLWLPVNDQCDRSGYRLPSDVEFEIACRSGTNTIRYHGDSTSLLSQYARYDQRNGLRTSPVARFKPNDLGLFDMLGNAYEICQSSSPAVNFKNQAAICGGCWVNDDIDVRSSTRAGPVDSRAPNMRGISDRFGFRVARTIRQGRLKR
jgi:formylglycine-generating enzyme required for sulfatase activity